MLASDFVCNALVFSFFAQKLISSKATIEKARRGRKVSVSLAIMLDCIAPNFCGKIFS